MKNKHLTIRISDELYQKCVKGAIKKSNEEGRIVKVSEIIRDILENTLKNE